MNSFALLNDQELEQVDAGVTTTKIVVTALILGPLFGSCYLLGVYVGSR